MQNIQQNQPVKYTTETLINLNKELNVYQRDTLYIKYQPSINSNEDFDKGEIIFLK